MCPVFDITSITSCCHLTGNKPQPEILLPSCRQFTISNYAFSFASVRNLPRENDFAHGRNRFSQVDVLSAYTAVAGHVYKPEASGAAQGICGQTGRTGENVLGKSPQAPLYLHKLLIYRLGAGSEDRTRIF